MLFAQVNCSSKFSFFVILIFLNYLELIVTTKHELIIIVITTAVAPGASEIAHFADQL